MTDKYRKDFYIEIASAVVVALLSVGLLVGIIWPGKVTGLIVPVALLAWFLLYREIKRRNF